MNSAELAERLVDLTKSWDVASALLGLKGTVISQVVLTCVAEQSHQRPKSLSEISAEISTYMGNDYVPLGFIAWKEFAPKQAKLTSLVLPEVSQDPWARGVFANTVARITNNLTANGVIIGLQH